MSDVKRWNTAAQIGSLVLANAMIFHEVLTTSGRGVKPLRVLMQEEDFWTALHIEWKKIQVIDYVPIFRVAEQILINLPTHKETQTALRGLAEAVLSVISERAALRHDLMGRIYHTLLREAKYLGTYYTSVPAATLLLKVALEPSRWKENWSNLDELDSFKVADLACGTGTLLMAAQQAITDNYVRSKVDDGSRVTEADLRDLHRTLMESVLYGYDVLLSAIHLTASTLAILAPDIAFERMNLYNLPLEGQSPDRIFLGSIDYAIADNLRIQTDWMREEKAGAAVTGFGEVASGAPLPKMDLCVMNPPFTRSVGGNLLFGSLPANQRSLMQRKLSELLRRVPDNGGRLQASSTAGLGSVFVAVADRHMKPGGRMALVLPEAVAFGVAWKPTRALISKKYVLETMIVSHDPHRWNFSDSTELSEILIVIRRLKDGDNPQNEETTCVNLWRNPTTVLEGLSAASGIARTEPAPIERSHGVAALMAIGETRAEIVSVPWAKIKDEQWHICAFAQTELVRTAYHLRQGELYIAPHGVVGEIPLTHLGGLGELGPDARDIHDGFVQSPSETSYPAFWSHDAKHVVNVAMEPNAHLRPLNKPKKGRPLRRVELLWPRAGGVMLAERMRLNTQALVAVKLPEPCLSNSWWPLRLNGGNNIFEKALVLWLNSTPGLTLLLSHRVPTQGAWVKFKKPLYEQMPVLDLWRLSDSQIKGLAETFDDISDEPLRPLPQMGMDVVRAKIDESISHVLGLPSLDRIRIALGREPVISLRRL